MHEQYVAAVIFDENLLHVDNWLIQTHQKTTQGLLLILLSILFYTKLTL